MNATQSNATQRRLVHNITQGPASRALRTRYVGDVNIERCVGNAELDSTHLYAEQKSRDEELELVLFVTLRKRQGIREERIVRTPDTQI